MDLHYLDRPNARRVQLDFFYDHRTNVQLYPKAMPKNSCFIS